MRPIVAVGGLLLLLFLAGVAGVLHGAAHRETVAVAPLVPDDPGWTGASGGWADIQWNFSGPYGVDAPDAWGNLVAAGAAGGRGVTVAVVDTGVAYPSDSESSPTSPDLAADRFVPGYDFVDDDTMPLDENGHGTHVASTIVEQTDNGGGLTGLAYGVDLMPVRVLDSDATGDAATIARGVQFAVDHGAQVVNLSLNFGDAVRPAALVELADALKEAHDQGVLVVVGAGNTAAYSVAFPASFPQVLAVGATTDSGCLANYSSHGSGVDLVAPGGGGDARVAHDHNCQPGRLGQPIFQVTFSGPRMVFDEVGYTGTSMAAAHVSACAALVIASGVVGSDPTPDEVAERLEQTSRDLGEPGYDSVYGWGLVDAATATTPGAPQRP
jgi:serine protease